MVLSQRCKTCLVLLRKAHTQTAVQGDYYKVLGIKPSASHAEIKAAYFELSKKHHPDRNQGSEESAKIFRLVKTAYEVLGSEKRRLQYDKERIFHDVRKPMHDYQTNPDYRDDAERMHFQSRARPPFRKYSQGKTSYYDFDAWFEGHYGKDSAAEIYEVRGPRKFRYHTSQEVKEENAQRVVKLQRILYIIFYTAIILSGIKIKSNIKSDS